MLKKSESLEGFDAPFSYAGKTTFTQNDDTHYDLNLHRIESIGLEKTASQLPNTKAFTRTLSIGARDGDKLIKFELTLFAKDAKALKFKSISRSKISLF